MICNTGEKTENNEEAFSETDRNQRVGRENPPSSFRLFFVYRAVRLPADSYLNGVIYKW